MGSKGSSHKCKKQSFHGGVHNKRSLVMHDDIRILLMGNPNVGKSVIFSKLTGLDVLTANYAGTTVSYTEGHIHYHGKTATLIDVPGTYSLEATSPAEEVAVNFLEDGANVVICVLDATNLERNLNLALQIKQKDIPIIYALNLIDVAENKGISIDVEKLEKELGAPVVTTVATRNVGLKELLDTAWEYSLKEAIPITPVHISQDERWQEVGRIVENVQVVEHRHPTFWDKVGDITVQPFPGLPIAMLVLTFSMLFVVGGGQGIRSLLLLPILNNYYIPVVTTFVSGFVAEGILLNVLVGEYGVLIKGIEWPFFLILPYVTLFYIVMSFLEDSGYLPRLGILLDSMLRRIGMVGSNIVPVVMGYGCAVPAILGTRAATTRKQRIMITSLVALAVPCTAQSGAFIALLGDQSIIALVFVYLVSFAAIIVAGYILDKLIPGEAEPMLMEVPNLLKPSSSALMQKIWIRIKQFLVEAEVPMLLGILFAALLVETGMLLVIGNILEPLVAGWLGLPIEASLALMLGIVRRELGVLPLLELELTTLQLIVGSLVALFYLPCVTVMAVIIKEFDLKLSLYVLGFTTITAFTLAGIFNQVARLLGFQ